MRARLFVFDAEAPHKPPPHPFLQLARLAKKLPTGDVAQMAHQLGGAAPGLAVGEGGEEDLT